jgi:hypothetical protein
MTVPGGIGSLILLFSGNAPCARKTMRKYSRVPAVLEIAMNFHPSFIGLSAEWVFFSLYSFQGKEFSK